MLRQVVADALERNSLGTSVTVDPADDQIDDQKAKAWWISLRGTNWLTWKGRWNFSVSVHPFSNKREMVICEGRCIWALNYLGLGDLYDLLKILLSVRC